MTEQIAQRVSQDNQNYLRVRIKGEGNAVLKLADVDVDGEAYDINSGEFDGISIVLGRDIEILTLNNAKPGEKKKEAELSIMAFGAEKPFGLCFEKVNFSTVNVMAPLQYLTFKDSAIDELVSEIPLRDEGKMGLNGTKIEGLFARNLPRITHIYPVLPDESVAAHKARMKSLEKLAITSRQKNAFNSFAILENKPKPL